MILLLLPLAGCGTADGLYDRNMERIGFSNTDQSVDRSLFRRIGAEPTNARLHFENGLFMLSRGSFSDLEVARVGFATASRLAPDWWLPELARAIVEYRLGHYDAALASYAEAIERRGRCGRLCYGLAMVAFRGGHFDLAAQALASARRAGPPEKPSERRAAEFLAQALADGAEARPAEPVRQRLRAALDIDTVKDDPNIAIDAYIIRKNRDSSSNRGINLLEALQLQFGSTLVNLERTGTTGSTPTTTRTQSVEVSIPAITYALNIASDDVNSFNIEAAPTVIASAGKTSRLFGGNNILIVPQGDDSESVERDIGLDLKVTPNEITDQYVDLETTMELSSINTTSVSNVTTAFVLQTEKTLSEVTAQIPFGRAVLLGAAASITSRTSDGGVPGLQSVPGVNNLFGNRNATVSYSNLLVLIAVRKAAIATMEARIDETGLSNQLFGAVPAAVTRISRLPSEAPAIDFLDTLQGD